MTTEEKKVLSGEAARKESARRSRRSFLVAGVAAAGGYGFYRWIEKSPGDEMIPRPLRKAFDFDHAIAKGLFDERGLAPTYPVSQSADLRINGNYGLKQDLVMSSYRLQVVGVDKAETMPQYVKDVTAWNYEYASDKVTYTGHDTKEKPKAEPNAGPAKDMSKGAATGKPTAEPAAADDSKMAPGFAAAFAAAEKANGDGRPMRGNEEAGLSDSTLDSGTPGLLLTMADVTKLNHTELVTQFKCIEGWSEIVHWGGYRLADFIAAYPPQRNAQGKLPKYVYMETPNGDYYTGYDLNECMHPQSLLCTEMAGTPLSTLHGAPLRLHMPIKYGYKQIKRIALIAYTDDKPDDYWTKLGYDWYAGL